MSYHIISIDSPQCEINSSRGQLIVTAAEGKRSLPMEDIAAVVITSFKCTLTSNFLIEAAHHRMGLIICETYKPVAIVLPVEKGTDIVIMRNLARLSPQLKRRLWDKTVEAKCTNQAELASQWAPRHAGVTRMAQIINAPAQARESDTARLFWRMFADFIGDSDFVRGRDAGGLNALFNYAYAILLSAVLRDLLALGLDPSFGIFHTARPHATPLAYDVMEPFRPAFDANVARWILFARQRGVEESALAEVTREFRKHIIGTLHAEVLYEGRAMTLRNAITSAISSFREAVKSLQSGPYHPWKISTIKWVG